MLIYVKESGREASPQDIPRFLPHIPSGTRCEGTSATCGISLRNPWEEPTILAKGSNIGSSFLFPWLLKALYRPVKSRWLGQRVHCFMSQNCTILPSLNITFTQKG